MAWQQPSSSISDLLPQLSANTISSLCILRARRTITPATFAALARALATNTSLVELSLTGQDVGVEGAQALSAALLTNRTLQVLALGHQEFGDAQLAALCHHGTFGALLALDLERRHITDPSPLARPLSSSSTCLTKLVLSRNALGDAGVVALALALDSSRVTSLTHLLLQQVDASAPGCRALATALRTSPSRLQVLDLSHNPTLGALGMTALARAPAHALLVDDCDARDEGALALAQGEPRIALSLADNGISSLAAHEFVHGLLANSPQLEHLVLARNTQFGTAGMAALALALHARASGLKHLDLSVIQADGLDPLLLARVDKLMFMGNSLEDTQAVRLALQPGPHTRVSALSLSGCKVEHPAAIFEALHGHPTLLTFEMGGVPLTQADRDALDALLAGTPTMDVAVDKTVSDHDAREQEDVAR